MRFAKLIPGTLALMISSVALAQTDWAEYVNREDHFTVNFPGEPSRDDLTYKTAKGTSLPGRIYKAQDVRGSNFVMTVVNYENASQEEFDTAIAEAAAVVRAKGTVKYDGPANLDGHRTQRLTVESANRRMLAEILVSRAKRLYITEADTALNAPPPANYQASIQVLDDSGVRIRYQGGQQQGAPGAGAGRGQQGAQQGGAEPDQYQRQP